VRDLAWIRNSLEHRLGDQLGLACLRPGEPLLARRWRPRWLALGIEQDRAYVNPGDPVDEAVMGLADDREPVSIEAVHQPQLPQRLGAI
jgi:hypothetical protein